MSLKLREDFFISVEIFAKALANARRFQLAEIISYGEKSVETLAADTGIGLTSVSSHLQILKNAGLVKTRKDGVRVYYSLTHDSVRQAIDAIKRASGERINEGAVHSGSYTSLSINELQAELGLNNCILLDVRPVEEFVAFHIPGAISVPVEMITEWARGYTGNKKVVIYCRGEYCGLSQEAVSELRKKGIQAAIYSNGISEWRSAGLPLEPEAA